MEYSFYSRSEYREKQRINTRNSWARGVFDFTYKKEIRKCKRVGCDNVFEVIPSNPKTYCCQSCSTIANNIIRGPLSEEIKQKISEKLTGRSNPLLRGIKIPRIEVKCSNPSCSKVFSRERWMRRKFCSNQCAMKVIGGEPTSPKASRGKAGIRLDINKDIYFYSRWEANIARIYNYLKVKWTYQPKRFDIGGHMYTPDFYLSDFNVYVEVKNFLWKYSKIRDEKFRKYHPDIELRLLLKDEYLELERIYSSLINNWEYKNSR